MGHSCTAEQLADVGFLCPVAAVHDDFHHLPPQAAAHRCGGRGRRGSGHFSLIQREGKVLEDRSSLVVLLFDLLTITTGAVMFCTEYLPKPMSKLPFIAHIGIFFALLLVAYALKLLCNELYAWLFGRDKEHSAINQYKFIFMTDFAILLFPLLVVIQYTGLREFYYVAAALLAILFSIWVYRLLKINSLEGHRFHFFLYFCTLEILPWLLFLKVMLII